MVITFLFVNKYKINKWLLQAVSPYFDEIFYSVSKVHISTS